MPTPRVAEIAVGGELSADLRDGLVSLRVYLLVFHASPQPLDEHVVHPPAPSMLILTPREASRPVNPSEVNWEPWPVLRISEAPRVPRRLAHSEAASIVATS